jgi:hypothetical protein
MRNRITGTTRQSALAEQAKIGVVIESWFGVAAIRREFEIFNHHFDVLFHIT